MATLIDSSVLIAGERGHLDFDDVLARYAEEDVAISAVTASELLHAFTARGRRRSAIGVRPSSRVCSRSFR